MLVRCLNCGLLWRRVTMDDNPGGTVANEDLCYRCPKCSSNAYTPEQPVSVPPVFQFLPYPSPSTTTTWWDKDNS